MMSIPSAVIYAVYEEFVLRIIKFLPFNNSSLLYFTLKTKMNKSICFIIYFGHNHSLSYLMMLQ